MKCKQDLQLEDMQQQASLQIINKNTGKQNIKIAEKQQGWSHQIVNKFTVTREASENHNESKNKKKLQNGFFDTLTGNRNWILPKIFKIMIIND